MPVTMTEAMPVETASRETLPHRRETATTTDDRGGIQPSARPDPVCRRSRSLPSSSTWASPARRSWSTSGTGWRWTTRASGTRPCCARNCPGGATGWSCPRLTRVTRRCACPPPPGPPPSSASSWGCRRGTSGPAPRTCRRRSSRTGSTTPWRTTTTGCPGTTCWPSGSTGSCAARAAPSGACSAPGTRGWTTGSCWTACCRWWTTGSR